jgi:hypothetical protein
VAENVPFKIFGAMNEVLVWLLGQHSFSNSMYAYHQYDAENITHVHRKW